MSVNRKKICIISAAAAAAAAVILMAGGRFIGNDDPPPENEVTYRVISGNGDSVYPIDEEKYSRPIETEFIDVPYGMTNRYGYDLLDRSERNIYNLLLNAMKNCDSSAEVPNIDSTGKLYTRILELIRRENPALFHIESRRIGGRSIASQRFRIEFTYKYTPLEVNTLLREAEKAADRIMSSVTGNMDEYDIVKLFHDSLITGCVTDESGEFADNIYGALVDGKAHCEGYAKAFSYLCGRAGIENIIVTGKTTDAHMWNMVKLDGNWYHVDVTWDNPPDIISSAHPDAVLYNYFLVSDAELSGKRTIDKNITVPPRAMGSAMNYFYHEGLYADSFAAALNCIESGCRAAVKNGRHSYMIKLASDDLYDTVLTGLQERTDGHGTALAEAVSNADFSGGVSYTNMFSDERIIMFMLDY